MEHNSSSIADFSDAGTVVTLLALSVIVLLTVCGNVLILWAVLVSSNLRGATHILIVNLAVADLLLGTLVLPFSVSLEVTGEWYFGVIFCDVWAAVDVLCCTASIMSLCVISVDRYIGVSRPLTYHSIMTQTRSAVMCLAVWILSLAISIGPLLGWKEREASDGSGAETTCTVTTQPGYVLFSVIGSFYLPMFVILVVYWRIYRTALEQTKFLESGVKTSKCSLSEVTLRVHVGRASRDESAETFSDRTCRQTRRKSESPANSSIEMGNEEDNRSAVTGFSLARNQLTNRASHQASSRLFKFRRQKKAAQTLGIVVGAFLLCWLPFFIILPLGAVCTSCWIPKPLFSFFFWLGYFNSCLNPFIYASTSREFQRAFRKILCRQKRALRVNSTHN